MASIARTGLLRQVQLLSSKPLRSTASPIRSSSSILAKARSQPNSLAATRIAPFSTSAQRKILPPGPQVVEGTVNDPAAVPKPHPTHGSYHWTFERLMSIGLIPLTIAPFAGQSMSPTMDALLVGSILIHSHIGFQALITDYIPTWQHPFMRKVFSWGLNLATLLVGIGFYEFETNDVGLTEGIKRIWHAGANDATVGAADISSLGHDGKLKNVKL